MSCYACRLPPLFFFKWPKLAIKFPRFWSDFFHKAVLKRIELPWVLTELAETFTIDVTFNYLEFGLKKPPEQNLWGQEIGVFRKNDRFLKKYPDFCHHKFVQEFP